MAALRTPGRSAPRPGSDARPVTAVISDSRHTGTVIVFLAVLATRVPFLGPGYGLDADAWRVALSARTIADTGAYQYSRMPGHAPHELMVALAPRAPAELWILVTAIVSSLAAALFWQLLGHYGVRDRWLATFAFALTPVIFIESVEMLDYMWSLACILGATLAILWGRRVLGGALLGLAAGFGITTALMGLPLVLMAIAAPTPADRWRERVVAMAAVAGPAIAVASLCFALPYITYGSGFLSAPAGNETSLIVAAWIASVGVWGIPGAAVLVVVAAVTLWSLARGRQHNPSMSARPGPVVITAWVSALILYALFYLKIRGEPSKLIPIVPFVLLLLARWADRRGFVIMCVALIISPFVGQLLKPLLPAVPSIIDYQETRQTEMSRLARIWDALYAEVRPRGPDQRVRLRTKARTHSTR